MHIGQKHKTLKVWHARWTKWLGKKMGHLFFWICSLNRHANHFCLMQETALFPSRIASEQESLVLVKRLLAVSISCISYLRGLFPESSYGTCYVDGNHVCCLNSITEIALEQEGAGLLCLPPFWQPPGLSPVPWPKPVSPKIAKAFWRSSVLNLLAGKK